MTVQFTFSSSQNSFAVRWMPAYEVLNATLYSFLSEFRFRGMNKPGATRKKLDVLLSLVSRPEDKSFC